MSIRSIGLIAFGLATVSAAAGGGYLALRHNAADSAKSDDVSVVTVDTPSPAVANQPAPEPRPVPASPARTRPAGKPRGVAPTTALSQPPVAAPSVATPPTIEPAIVDASTQRVEQAPPTPEPAKLQVEELTVVPDSVIGIRLDSSVSSETAHVEDKISARVTRDVVVSGRTAISAGARLEGVVTTVDRGTRFKDRARLGVRFQYLVLADNTRLPIQTETIFREGESPAPPAATKIGASAAIGGILGAVIGGKKGAAIGSTVGAAGGTAAVMAGDAPSAVLQAGTPLTVRLTAPVTLAIERQDAN